MATKKRYKDYAEYLKSAKWKQVKDDYDSLERTDACLCCGSYFDEIDSAPNYHHFRYSKDWNYDSHENLIIVCEDCHESIHCHFEHDSEPISLRTYLLSLMEVIKEKEQHHQFELNMDALWCDVRGSFSITQDGVTKDKSMDLKYTTRDRSAIGFFERRRDDYLAKKETSVTF